MEYSVNVRHTGKDSSPFTYRGTCRESLLYKMYGALDGSTNISFTIKGTSNIFVEEVCNFLQVKLESKKVENAWEAVDYITISGNDDMILSALYWVVTAQRANQFKTEAKTFLELIQQAETEAEWYHNLDFDKQWKVKWAVDMPAFHFLFYGNSSVAEGSLTAWQGFLDGSIEVPTSSQLISSGDIMLEYLQLEY